MNSLHNFVFCFSLQIKCEQYWPTDGAELYGDIEVTVTDWIEFANYTITTLQICKVSIRSMYLPVGFITSKWSHISHFTNHISR